MTLEDVNALEIGDAIAILPVTGGSVNEIWRVRTTRGEFAIKNLQNTSTEKQKQIEISEEICQNMSAKGVSAACALSKDGLFCRSYKERILVVYPWVNGTVEENPSCSQVTLLGSTLKSLHDLDMQVKDAKQPTTYSFQEKEWTGYISQGKALEAPWIEKLDKHLDEIIHYTDLYEKSGKNVKEKAIISHNDINKGNIIWHPDSNGFTLIDWERAGWTYPTYEWLYTSLKWGKSSGDRTQMTFFAEGYGKLPAKERIKEASLMLLGHYLNWLRYNLHKYRDEPVIRTLTTSTILDAWENIDTSYSLLSKGMPMS